MGDTEKHIVFGQWEYDRQGAIIIYRGSLRKRLHRYLYEVLIDEIPERHALQRICSTKRCVNPYHFKVYDPTQGMRNRTHCPKGHEYTPSTLGIRPSGRRYCRICQEERNAKRRKGTAGYTQTECKRGHDISTDSAVYIFFDAQGRRHRRCRVCHRAKVAASKAAAQVVSSDAA